MKINQKVIGYDKVYVIAEASANHGMKESVAKEMVIQAALAGADAIKFQTYTPEEIAAPAIRIPLGVDEKHDAWIRSLGNRNTLRDLLAGGGLPRKWHKDLKKIADDYDIHFMSTPFSVDAAKFLVEEVGVPAVKVASGDITFYPLLDYLGALDIPVILSTGGADMHDIVRATNYLNPIDGNMAVLHCNSTYPCHTSQVNLRAIDTLKKHFRGFMQGLNEEVVIGYSDHTLNVDWVPVSAVLMGANIIEKHFKISSSPHTADSQHSIDVSDLKVMIRNINDAILALGTGAKFPHANEMHDRLWARRSPSDWLRPTDEARSGRWQ